MSPTQRALKLLRGRGWIVAITEKWNSFAKIRQDVYGFGDLLGIDTLSKEIVLIQVTSGSNHATRKTKILAIDAAKEWVLAGGLILLMSFKKNKSGRYESREEYIKI